MDFETKRLILRSITNNDTQDVFDIRGNEIVDQFIKRKKPKNLKDALDFIHLINKNEENKIGLYFGICEKSSDKIIGTVCLWKFSEDFKKAELGYELLPQFHHLGFMSEAVEFIIDHGFNVLKLEKIEAFTERGNQNSIKLLTKFNFIKNENRVDENKSENVIFELNK
ncbi:GNAT family N-acetyltransferase [Halpernia frigidisoli]|uniref:Ribosomal-protein-alanine N-acetyltransferase n=1 Tax=Halpernia frigidisoli TaxID=1125876 RepID=A0A1I3FG93_9FLAO|nr:GNAT family N-acetyltransferase [Halpernia frigidisoli]SFI10249.1 ribosomal-protein-alanine N-acetyltransferase [Halpernia frigidisoli]